MNTARRFRPGLTYATAAIAAAGLISAPPNHEPPDLQVHQFQLAAVTLTEFSAVLTPRPGPAAATANADASDPDSPGIFEAIQVFLVGAFIIGAIALGIILLPVGWIINTVRTAIFGPLGAASVRPAAATANAVAATEQEPTVEPAGRSSARAQAHKPAERFEASASGVAPRPADAVRAVSGRGAVRPAAAQQPGKASKPDGAVSQRVTVSRQAVGHVGSSDASRGALRSR